MLQELQAPLTSSQIVQLAAIDGKWKMVNLIHDDLHFRLRTTNWITSTFLSRTGPDSW